jgi:hypothetical protein
MLQTDEDRNEVFIILMCHFVFWEYLLGSNLVDDIVLLGCEAM